jgi:hypothetical protein
MLKKAGMLALVLAGLGMVALPKAAHAQDGYHAGGYPYLNYHDRDNYAYRAGNWREHEGRERRAQERREREWRRRELRERARYMRWQDRGERSYYPRAYFGFSYR